MGTAVGGGTQIGTNYQWTPQGAALSEWHNRQLASLAQWVLENPRPDVPYTGYLMTLTDAELEQFYSDCIDWDHAYNTKLDLIMNSSITGADTTEFQTPAAIQLPIQTTGETYSPTGVPTGDSIDPSIPVDPYVAPSSYVPYASDFEFLTMGGQSGASSSSVVASIADTQWNSNSYASQQYGVASQILGYLGGLNIIVGNMNNGLNFNAPTKTDSTYYNYTYGIPVTPILDDDDFPDPATWFDYVEVVYSSVLLDALKQQLIDDMVDGGTGLSAGVENEMYARESERDKQELEDTIDRIATRWSESGFTLPDGVLAAQTTWADLQYQNAKSDKSRKIAEDSFKTAIQQKQFTIEQSVRLEPPLMVATTEANKNKVVAATAILDAGIRVYEAKLKKIDRKVELYKAQGDIYDSTNRHGVGMAQADVARFKAESDLEIGKMSLTEKQLEFQVQVAQINARLTADVSMSAAECAARISAAALSQINVSTSEAHNVSESISTDTNFQTTNYAARSKNENYNENWNYQGTATAQAAGGGSIGG